MKSKVCVITASGSTVCGRPASKAVRASGAVPRSKDAKLEAIAKHRMGIDTLVTRKSDRLDFHSTAVWSVRNALDAAYRKGVMDANHGIVDPELRMPDAAATALAQRAFGFPTLETRRSDSLDFRDVAVWSVKDALGTAYDAGKRAGKVGASPSRVAAGPTSPVGQDAKVQKIAKEHLGIGNLTPRNGGDGDVDFRYVSVGGLRDAVDAAYRAGGGRAALAEPRLDAMMRKHLGIRAKSNPHDAHSVSVVPVRALLNEAYAEGRTG